jgi:short-subunit dehydrogenase
MAIKFAKMGAKLSLSDINMEGLEETKRMIHQQTGRDNNVCIFKCDVSKKEAVAEGAQIAR